MTVRYRRPPGLSDKAVDDLPNDFNDHDDGQCDQNVEKKVAEMFPKVAHIISTAVNT